MTIEGDTMTDKTDPKTEQPKTTELNEEQLAEMAGGAKPNIKNNKP